MISQRIRGLNSLLVLSQLTLVLLFYWLHFLVIDVLHAPVPSIKSYELYCIIIYVALLIEAFRRLNEDTNFLQRNRIDNHRVALEQTVFVAAVVAVFLVITRDRGISLIFLLSFMPVLYGLLFVSASYLPGWLAQMTFRGVRQERTLLVGSCAKAADIRNWLERKSDLGIRTIGMLSDEEDASPVGGVRLLGTSEDLENVVRDYDVTQVIAVELPMYPHILQQMTNICEQLGIRLLVLSDLESKFRHPITYFEDDGLLFISLREEPLENPFNRFLKRTVDIAVSLPVIVFILPVTSLVVWVFQTFQAPGPLFHIQDRAGFQNRRFRIVKYRTMHADNREVARQATKDDQRIYPAGKWFRKFSIDELPQFWNVLRGEMSVVGPRPHLIEHNHEFATIMSNYHVRAFVKPGITGLAQVSGFRGETRSADDLIQRIKLDIHYLENWSLGLDLLIIARTAWQMLRPPRSAY